MLTILLVSCTLPSFLMLLHLISRHAFPVLLLWLLIAPAVTNFIMKSQQQVLYQTSGDEKKPWEEGFYDEAPATITLQKLIQPNRMIFSVFLVIFLLDNIVKKRRLISPDRTEIWMIIFSLILIANVFLWSKRLAFGLHTAIDAFIIPFISYYVTRRLVTSEHRFRQLIQIIGYMGFYVIVLCIIERLTITGLYYRLRGPFESGNTLHVIMVIVFFTMLLQFLQSKYLHENKTALTLCLRVFVISLSPVIIVLSQVRGNWIGFLSGVCIFLLLARNFISPLQKIGMIGLSLAFTLLLAIGLQLLIPNEFFVERAGDVGTVMGRFDTWKATIKQAGQAPFFGVGLNNLHGLLAKLAFQKVESESNVYSTPHNSLLSNLVELGLVGLFIYLAILALLVQKGWRLYRRSLHPLDAWRGIIAIAIIVAYQVPSLFAHTMAVPGLIHIYVYVFLGAISGLYGKRWPMFDSSSRSSHSWVVQSDNPAFSDVEEKVAYGN